MTAQTQNIRKDGTTDEQWAKYEADVKAHEHFIERYRFYLDRIVKHMEFVRPQDIWTAAEVRRIIGNEIDKAESMDAPNRPGYYRANND